MEHTKLCRSAALVPHVLALTNQQTQKEGMWLWLSKPDDAALLGCNNCSQALLGAPLTPSAVCSKHRPYVHVQASPSPTHYTMPLPHLSDNYLYSTKAASKQQQGWPARGADPNKHNLAVFATPIPSRSSLYRHLRLFSRRTRQQKRLMHLHSSLLAPQRACEGLHQAAPIRHSHHTPLWRQQGIAWRPLADRLCLGQ